MTKINQGTKAPSPDVANLLWPPRMKNFAFSCCYTREIKLLDFGSEVLFCQHFKIFSMSCNQGAWSLMAGTVYSYVRLCPTAFGQSWFLEYFIPVLKFISFFKRIISSL